MTHITIGQGSAMPHRYLSCSLTAAFCLLLLLLLLAAA
jgi:hypothetical protein